MTTGRTAAAAIPVVEEIGRDAALTPADLSAAVRVDRELLRACWTAYERHWARFCGARLDPQFWHLTHPARWCGVPGAADRAPIVVVGTGPSLAAGLPLLTRVRPHVHIITSPRGADALADAGLTADLVLIEHQTPLDAAFSVQALTLRRPAWRDRVPLIATDERTPAPLLLGVPSDRLFVLRPLPTWGLWPATAVATALMAGAATVGLLGVDLGTPDGLDPRHRPLADLLTLLAAGSTVRCVDLGTAGATKPGWPRAALADIAAPRVCRPLTVERHPWTPRRERLDRAAAAWHRLESFVDQARAALAIAGRARDGGPHTEQPAALRGALHALLDWGGVRQVRDDVQNGLGCGFLPRYWRTPPEMVPGPSLWRPVALCAHEIIAQHRSLGARLQAAGRAS